jgi:hypothetical protein
MSAPRSLARARENAVKAARLFPPRPGLLVDACIRVLLLLEKLGYSILHTQTRGRAAYIVAEREGRRACVVVLSRGAAPLKLISQLARKGYEVVVIAPGGLRAPPRGVLMLELCGEGFTELEKILAA